MKHKILLTSLLGLTIACPSFAAVDISKNASDPGCTNSVLKTYTGPTDLEADYTANTINLNFYSDENTVYSTGTCTYDGGIELPEEDPTRTGYTFDGWQVRRAAANNSNQSGGNNQTTFDLSTLAQYIYTNGIDSGWIVLDGSARVKDTKFGLTQNGEWATEFSYGTLKGVSQCIFEQDEYCEEEEICDEDPETGEETCEMNMECRDTNVYNCYCQATGFDAENDGTFVSAYSSWEKSYISELYESECMGNCAEECAHYRVGNDWAFRRDMYGVTQ